MTNTSGSAPPIFADSVKFNGANWVIWHGLIKIAADLRGVSGYFDGSIANPALTTMSPSAIPLPASPPGTATVTQTPPATAPQMAPATSLHAHTESPWESLIPSPSEWRVRNAWAMGLLIYNTSDPVGLGINIHGSAADAWSSYIDTYQVASEVAIFNAELDLRNMTYADGQDFVEFISRIRIKWSNASALGANIDDKAFRTIILNALPRSWDPIVTTLYTTCSSRDAINQLMTHWSRISRDRVTNSQTTTSALQANTNGRGRDHQQSQNQLTCSNQNCNRRGHAIEDCYWPGGGKAGQFPPGFGKHGGVRGSANVATTTNGDNSQQMTSANVASTTSGNSAVPTVYALASVKSFST